MKRSEHAKQRTAARAARRVRILGEARAMARKVDGMVAADRELVSMRDELVKLMHEVGQLKKRPTNRVILQ
jgi:hypothetical protein